MTGRGSSHLILPLAAAALIAGCGGNGSKLSAAQQKNVKRELRRLVRAYPSGPKRRPSPSRSPLSRRTASPPGQPTAEKSDVTVAPPPLPGEGGRLKLNGTYRAELRGGPWLVPAGQVGAGGRAIVKFYGTSELCWRFRDLRGIQRPVAVGIFQGRVELHANQPPVLVLKLRSGFDHVGCQTGIPSELLRPIEASSGRYLIGISTNEHVVAVGAQL